VKGKLEGVDEAKTQRTENPPTAAETKAVAAAPLAFRALWAIVTRFFKRLLGKGEERNK
jgi:hypothetical protein